MIGRTGRDDLCWACGRYSRAGACTGPHPEWEADPEGMLRAAIAQGHVTGIPFPVVTPESTPYEVALKRAREARRR